MERKVVIVTGGTSGIGLATCKHLQKQGCIVYGTSRTATDGEVVNEITLVNLSLDDKPSIHRAVSFVLNREKRIDVLVNNAGYGMAGSIEDCTNEEIKEVFQANIFGLLECCRAVIPQMRKQKSGQIINISSIGGEFGLPYRGIYSASKSAVDRLSETLRMELLPWNIKVSFVQPGDFNTSINANRKLAAKSLKPESPYYKVFKKEYEHISKEVSKGQDPIVVAKVIWKIIQSPRPKLRYPVATFELWLAMILNRIIPWYFFQKILINRYPVE